MRITVSQLRRIIKEEVSRVTRSRSRRRLSETPGDPLTLEGLCELVGYGEPEDYADTLDLVQKCMNGKIKFETIEDVETAIADSIPADFVGMSPGEEVQAARQICVEYGLEDMTAMAGHAYDDF